MSLHKGIPKSKAANKRYRQSAKGRTIGARARARHKASKWRCGHLSRENRVGLWIGTPGDPERADAAGSWK